MKKLLSLVLLIGLFTACAHQTKVSEIPLIKADRPNKIKMQTKANLYAFAKNTAPYLKAHKDAILIDVRTPEELEFTGWAPRTNIHVPLYLVDQSRDSWNKKKSQYGFMGNRFKKQVAIELKKLHVKKDQIIFTMCRSGSSRSPRAADILTKMGYTNVYTILNGFEGHKRKDGNRGARTINGWKNSGAEWSYKLDPKIVWFDTKYE